MAVLVLTGCAPDNTPTSYDAQVETSFMRGCTGGPDILLADGVTTTIASNSYCRCSYGVYVANVPYNDDDKKNRDGGKAFVNYGDKLTFVKLNTEVKDDPTKLESGLPDDVKAKLAACPKTQENTSGSVPGSSGTTPGGTAPKGTTPVSAPSVSTPSGTTPA